MKQLAPFELDEKIQGFMARKMSQFPELDVERHHARRGLYSFSNKLKSLYIAPFIQLET